MDKASKPEINVKKVIDMYRKIPFNTPRMEFFCYECSKRKPWNSSAEGTIHNKLFGEVYRIVCGKCKFPKLFEGKENGHG